jgi:hypothetical protein
MTPMKGLQAMFVFIVMTAAGVALFAHGSPWLFVLCVIAYTLVFAKAGCLTGH